MHLHGSPQLLMAARYLQYDGDQEIRELSTAILNDDDILLYHLDPPPLD